MSRPVFNNARFLIPPTEVAWDGRQKVRSMLTSTGPVGDPDRHDNHRYVDPQVDSTIYVGVQTASLDVSEFGSGVGINPAHVRENEWVFVLKRQKQGFKEGTVVLPHWQLNILLEIMTVQALGEIRGYLDIYGAPFFDPLVNSEEEIWKYAQTTSDGTTGQLSIVAFLCARHIMNTFAFLGITKTNAELQAPEGYGHTIAMGGFTRGFACCLTRTKEMQNLWWILKRRNVSAHEYGAFAFHMISLTDGAPPSLALRFYKDMADYTQRGVAIKIGFIAEKESEDPSPDYARAVAGLVPNSSLAKTNAMIQRLERMGVVLTNYGVKNTFIV